MMPPMSGYHLAIIAATMIIETAIMMLSMHYLASLSPT